MTRPPTDLEILKEIYNRYYEDFCIRQGTKKIYVPIDIRELAKALSVDPDIVFGRLYYHCNRKYGYKEQDGVNVDFFTLQAGDERHCVQFPLLASVLATLADDKSKLRRAEALSVAAILISLASLLIAALKP